jgi:HEAT repeat protein
LLKLLASDKDNEVRRQSATALGLIGDRSATSALRSAAESDDPHLRDAAVEALRLMESKPESRRVPLTI